MSAMLKDSVEKAKALLVEKLSEPDFRKLRFYLGRMVSVVELCEALEQEIEDRRRRREAGVGPFYGESQQLIIYTVEGYLLNLEVVHAVELEVGVSYVVKVWEEEGKVYPSRVVYGRIKYLGLECRKEARGKAHDLTFNRLEEETI